MKILIINGPNLNGFKVVRLMFMFKSLSDLESMLIGKKHDVNLEFFQSNLKKRLLKRFTHKN